MEQIYEPNDKFDFSEFETLIEPRQIKSTFKIFKNLVKTSQLPDRKLAILTARGSKVNDIIKDYLKKDGLYNSNIEIITLGDANPQAKAGWIAKQIENGFVEVEFWDDSQKNLDGIGVDH